MIIRKYLILVKDVQQAKNIVNLFDNGYKIKKECCTSDYAIIKMTSQLLMIFY